MLAKTVQHKWHKPSSGNPYSSLHGIQRIFRGLCLSRWNPIFLHHRCLASIRTLTEYFGGFHCNACHHEHRATTVQWSCAGILGLVDCCTGMKATCVLTPGSLQGSPQHKQQPVSYQRHESVCLEPCYQALFAAFDQLKQQLAALLLHDCNLPMHAAVLRLHRALKYCLAVELYTHGWMSPS